MRSDAYDIFSPFVDGRRLPTSSIILGPFFFYFIVFL
jgi:hypothetical protein